MKNTSLKNAFIKNNEIALNKPNECWSFFAEATECSKRIMHRGVNVKDGYLSEKMKYLSVASIGSLEKLEISFTWSESKQSLINSLLDNSVGFGSSNLLNLAYLLSQERAHISVVNNPIVEHWIFVDEESDYVIAYVDGTVIRVFKSWMPDSHELILKKYTDQYQTETVMSFDAEEEHILSGLSDGCIRLPVSSAENSLVFDWDYQTKRMSMTNNLLSNLYLRGSHSYIYQDLINTFHPEEDNNRLIFPAELSVKDIKTVIGEFKKLAEVQNSDKENSFSVYFTRSLESFLSLRDNRLSEKALIGKSIKSIKDPEHDDIGYLKADYEDFKRAVDEAFDGERRLYEKQKWAAFHMAMMGRSANFSVPGAGKTSIVYAAYSYLKSKGKVRKLMVIGPIGSFMAWQNEYIACYGNSPMVFNYRTESLQDEERNLEKLKNAINASDDLFLINYEAINEEISSILESEVDDTIMVVCDEIHRIKNSSGVISNRIRPAISNAAYKVALTGTPIPNSASDLYPIFSGLFNEDYDSYFKYGPTKLAQIEETDEWFSFTEKINPFYFAITKDDLNLPPVKNEKIEVHLTKEQTDTLKMIYNKFSSDAFVMTTRIMQAQMNPAMIIRGKKVSGLEESDDSKEADNYIKKHKGTFTSDEMALISSYGFGPKMDKCVEIVEKLIGEDKRVMVWGVFIETISEIFKRLSSKGYRASLIYGDSSEEERENAVKQFNTGLIDVLISNPNTMGESVSLHKSCHDAVFVEYSFNLVHLLQAKDRIHRVGLPPDAETHYYFIACKYAYPIFPNGSSLDDIVLTKLLSKEKKQRSAISNDRIGSIKDAKKPTKKDFQTALGHIII